MPEFILDHGSPESGRDMPDVAIDMATMESRFVGGNSPGFGDLAPAALPRIIADCNKFRDDAKIVACIGDKDPQAGHDFWLTRNGHGAGFWDGDWPEPDATYLDARSATFGNVDSYVGDDGLIYLA